MPISDPESDHADDPSVLAALAALGQILEPNERIDLFVPAVGCMLALTDRRLAVVRDGAESRPRSGIASYLIDEALTVRLEPARRRMVIDDHGGSSSVFIRSVDLPEIVALIAEVHRRTHLE